MDSFRNFKWDFPLYLYNKQKALERQDLLEQGANQAGIGVLSLAEAFA